MLPLISLLGCSDQALVQRLPVWIESEPEVEVVPATIDLGEVPLGCQVTARVEVRNIGEGPLDVAGTWLDGSSDDCEVENLETTLTPHTTADLRFSFRPDEVGPLTASVTVASDDPDEQILEVPVTAVASDASSRLDIFYQRPEPIDVLWVVDNSGSMWQERERIKENLVSFFGWFESLELDYHMGVVTTDVENPIFSGRLFGEPTYVTPTTPDAALTFAKSLDFGVLETGPEAGLAAMELALSEPLLSSFNSGFYRDDARLSVIFVSDEPDYSSPNADHYVQFLEALKPESRTIYAAAIVGDYDHGCRGRCDGEIQTASSGDKYIDVVNAFDGSTKSICSCDLAPALARIGLDSTAYGRTYRLSRAPGDPTLLEVWVNQVLASGWSYDAETRSVVFEVAPPRDSEIVVRYPVPVVCGDEVAVPAPAGP